MTYQLVKIKDPLLMRPGLLIKPTDALLGVETEKGRETILHVEDNLLYLDVQPSRRGISYFRFKVLRSEFIYIEATILEFSKWFREVRQIIS